MKRDCPLLIDKKECRDLLMKKRNALTLERREVASKALTENVLTFCNRFSHVLSFASLTNEIDLSSLNQVLVAQKKLLLPKVEEENLSIFQVNDLSSLIPSKWNVKEPPSHSAPFDLKQIPCILVPGLGFDLEGNRIGYGKGHYDRFLEKMPYALKIGVGFREQFVQALPVERHDQKLDHFLLF